MSSKSKSNRARILSFVAKMAAKKYPLLNTYYEIRFSSVRRVAQISVSADRSVSQNARDPPV